uniref:Serine proteinase n=1 Tax=Volvariella volvacea TaxID=36659 RepID=A0A0D3ML53_9AGAR|nr:serine proteinase [Volvariella volvacea]
MRFSIFAIASVVFAVVPAYAAPSPLRQVERYDGETTGRYIIVLKDGVSKDNVLGNLRTSGAPIEVAAEWDIINGFSSELDEASLNALRASDDVAYITEDGIATISATQTNAPWGLGRISQDGLLSNQNAAALTFTYTYHDSAGAGVDVYVVDTGVYTAHTQFEGRARWGATFGGYANADGNGHGTHCAGTIAGSQFGVAKAASIIAVKVLSDGGSGAWADIISGLNWVGTQASASGRPSVVSMSLGGVAIHQLTSLGVHVVVAAGNNNANAANYSPARAPSAITVGASTIADARASFSNYGTIVDVFAPGQSVISAWIGGTTATNSISGTSMATPHVAGLAAYFISKDGNLSPAALEAKIKDLSVKNALSGLRKCFCAFVRYPLNLSHSFRYPQQLGSKHLVNKCPQALRMG